MRQEVKIRNLWLISFLADFIAILCAYYTAIVLRFHSIWGEKVFEIISRIMQINRMGRPGDLHEAFYLDNAPRIIVYLTVTILSLYALRDLYAGRRFIRRRPVAWNVIVVNIMALLAFYVYFYLTKNIFHPRSFFVTVLFFNVFYCVWFRGISDRVLSALRTKLSIDECRAVLVGENRQADMIYEYVQSCRPQGINIVNRMAYHVDQPFEISVRAIEASCREHGSEMIILADKQFTISQIMEILEMSDSLDVSVKVLSDKMDVLMNQARMPSDIIDSVPLVHFDRPSNSRMFLLPKQISSVFFTCLLMVVVVPIMAGLALLIKLTSKGGAFFTQERMGVNRKPFMMYKFRTMHEKSDELQAQVEEFNESGAGLFKIRKDPRVTPIGRFLRRFSLDELPQLVNVIAGKMTLVGPRPLPRRDFENYYEEWHYSRHSGMPGLTCLWQVSGRSEIDFHNMCILDVYYLRNQSWVLDVKILLRTFWVVLFAKGAY